MAPHWSPGRPALSALRALDLNGARYSATAPAPGPVAVSVPVTTAHWTLPSPPRRGPCRRACHPALTPAPLHWGGGTIARFWTAAGLPYKSAAFVHG